MKTITAISTTISVVRSAAAGRSATLAVMPPSPVSPAKLREKPRPGYVRPGDWLRLRGRKRNHGTHERARRVCAAGRNRRGRRGGAEDAEGFVPHKGRDHL